MNIVEYVWDSPTNLTDPSGEQFVPGTPNAPPTLFPVPPVSNYSPPPSWNVGTLRPGLVPRPPSLEPIPWPVWLRTHGMGVHDRPIRYGCGGIVGIRCGYDPPPQRKPGTKCTTVYEDAIAFLAREQSQGRRPLLIAVQLDVPIPITATPGCCDIDGRTDIPGEGTNFMCFLGENKWKGYWEGASCPPTDPKGCVVRSGYYNPFGKAQTFFCIVQNPYNPSPDVQ
jgi:hypothetical protein